MDKISFELMSYFEEVAKDRPELHQIMREVAAAIAEREYLERVNEELKAAVMRLTMDEDMLREHAERLAHNRLNKLELQRQVRKLHESWFELQEVVQTIDLANTVKVDWMSKHSEMMEDMQQLKEEYKRKKERFMQMENRKIMQEFYNRQAELAAAKEELERMQRATADEAAALKSKLSAVEAQKNLLIADVDEGRKELEALRNELKKCQEASEGNAGIQSTQGLNSTYTLEQAMTSTEDTPTPTLMSQQLAASSNRTFRFPAWSTIFAEMQKTWTSIEPEPTAPLASILKKPQADGTQDYESLNTQPKSVHFVSPSPSTSSVASSAHESSKLVKTKDRADAAMSICAEEAVCDAEPTVQMDATEDAEPTVPMDATEDAEATVAINATGDAVPSVQMDIIEEDNSHRKTDSKPPQQDSKDASLAEKPKISIIECRTIKPAGTPLPPKLPIEMTLSEEAFLGSATGDESAEEETGAALLASPRGDESESDFMRQFFSADEKEGADSPAEGKGFERVFEMSDSSLEDSKFKFSDCELDFASDGNQAATNDDGFNFDFGGAGWPGDSNNDLQFSL